MDRPSPTLSILIATAGRRESLRRTLADLGPLSGREHIEVLVVDNAPAPELSASDLAALPGGAARLLHEPAPGKAHALNRALREPLGPIVAILDDDMEPMTGWADAVIRSVEARPRFDIFAGRSHVIWPAAVPEPPWASHWLARGMAFSAIDWGDADREMGIGNVSHPSGNHFWFRRTVLEHVSRFPPIWATEPAFVAAAWRHGHRGVFVPEIRCGHRIQPQLVDAQAFIDRAVRYGRAKAGFLPDDQGPFGAAPSRRSGPMVWRAKRLAWWFRGLRARLLPQASRVPALAHARLQFAYYDQMLLNASRNG